VTNPQAASATRTPFDWAASAALCALVVALAAVVAVVGVSAAAPGGDAGACGGAGVGLYCAHPGAAGVVFRAIGWGVAPGAVLAAVVGSLRGRGSFGWAMGGFLVLFAGATAMWWLAQAV
jgi:hypothetical protein